MRSVFIAIEGIDGSGGTTQARMLADWFRQSGQPEVVLTCEPSHGPVGKFIREALKPGNAASVLADSVLPFLFAADRRDHLDREIIPALQRGAAVITDRYYHSSLAYQSLSIGMPAVADLNERFRAPDLTVFLDLDPEISLARIEARGEQVERFEALDRLQQIHESYDAVLIHCRAAGEHVVTIEADAPVDEIHRAIVVQVDALLEASD
jgi:dTMP kinase